MSFFHSPSAKFVTGALKCARLEFSGCRVKPPTHATHTPHNTHNTQKSVWSSWFGQTRSPKRLAKVGLAKVGLAKLGRQKGWPKSVWPKSVWPKLAMTHRATSVNSSVCSDAQYEMVEDEDAFVEAPWRQAQIGQTFFELEIPGYRLLQNVCLS